MVFGRASRDLRLAHRSVSRWAVVAAGVFSLLALLISWDFARYDRRLKEREFQTEVGAISQLIQARIETHAQALVHLAARWAYSRQQTAEWWAKESSLVLGHFRGFQAVGWVDAASHVRWIAPLEGHQAIAGLDLNSGPRQQRAAETARATRQPQTTGQLDVAPGGQGFYILAPIFRGEQFEGFILGFFRCQAMLDQVLPQHLERGYGLLLQEGQETVYRRGEPAGAATRPWLRRADVQLPGTTWRLEGWPTEELLSQKRPPAPRIYLVGGLLLSGLVALLIHWRSQVARKQGEAREAARGLIAEAEQWRQATETFWRREVELADYFENAEVALHLVGLDGRIRRANKAELAMLGYAPEEYVGHYIGEFHADPEAACDILERLARREELFDYPARLRRQDGAVREVRINSTARWQDGEFVCARCSTRDVTAELAARRELSELAAALENAVDGIAWVDPAGRFTAVNQAYAGALGRTPGEMLGTSWQETVHPEDQERLWEAHRQMQEEGKAECEVRGLRPDGSALTMQVVLVARGGVDGPHAGHYCFMRDITARKRGEEALRESNARLEASNQDLADFAAAASHDMQEPLRKIQAFSDLLKLSYAGVLDEQGRQYLDRLYRSAERMRTLVRDLLTLSRVAKTPPAPEVVDLEQVAREVVCDLELQIQAAGGRVEIGELPAVLADPTQMRQLLQNLIGNALKFRRKDAPPEVSVSGTRQEGGRCMVEVRDNGIGFEEQYAEAVFAPFRRLHGRGEYDGTGLGLSVCRRIAERHSGAIWAHSRPGCGSTFVVTLPAAPGAAMSPAPSRSAT